MELIERAKNAVAFYDKVVNATEEERIAAGTDHYDLVIDTLREISEIKALQPPPGFEECAKTVATEFYYWWHNQQGANTQDGFDTWAETDGKELLSTHSTYDKRTHVAVPIGALDRLLVLCDEVVDGHRDRQSSNYNECDLPGEQCKWCADYLKNKAMLKAGEQGDA